ncbi:MAG: VUT family protein [Clostridiales bacterium]|nr:VUT family protein [Clostridiales bacterium]
MGKIKTEIKEFVILLRSVPTAITVLFAMTLIAMNLLANKSIDIPLDFLALDCGIAVSWFAFFAMDVVTKHFGPKAATQLSIFALLVNLAFCLFMFIGSAIPGSWGEAFTDSGIDGTVNGALDKTFGGTWYVLVGSSVAFVASAIINNFSNYAVGKLFKKNPDGALAYVLRTYLSTAIGQFADNLIFALIVSHFFFGWTMLQCVTCAATGMVAELLCEALFTFFGYKITKRWKARGVGKEYFDFLESKNTGGKTTSESQPITESEQA